MNKLEQGNALKNRIVIEKIKLDLNMGEITYGQAKILAKPIIESMNKDIEVIAKKYNKRPYKLSFAGLMR